MVDASRYFLMCCRYVELNPVRAGIVGRPEDYRWSSYRHHAHGTRHEHLVPHHLYRALGSSASERQEAYRALFRDSLEAHGIEEIRGTINGGWPLGDDRFKDEIEDALRRAVRPPKRGRPIVKCGRDPN
jgi:putative transposase